MVKAYDLVLEPAIIMSIKEKNIIVHIDRSLKPVQKLDDHKNAFSLF